MSMVAFLTETGLRFFDIEDDNVNRMHDAIQRLVAIQKPDKDHVFCITVENDNISYDLRVKHVMVELRVQLMGRGF